MITREILGDALPELFFLPPVYCTALLERYASAKGVPLVVFPMRKKSSLRVYGACCISGIEGSQTMLTEEWRGLRKTRFDDGCSVFGVLEISFVSPFPTIVLRCSGFLSCGSFSFRIYCGIISLHPRVQLTSPDRPLFQDCLCFHNTVINLWEQFTITLYPLFNKIVRGDCIQSFQVNRQVSNIWSVP
jgi:hypothetical protein